MHASPPPSVQVDRRDLIGLRNAARGLRLRVERPVGSPLTGVQRSRLRGRGMDYLESRHYQAGDDVRSMDWRVTARAGAPYVKLYVEERERPVVVVVDLGPGMFFATRGAFKSVVAARAAALIGWAAVAHGDRIGALVLDDGHQELKPRGGRRGVLTLIDALARAGTLEATPRRANPVDFDAALERLRRVARPGSLLVLISDFLALGDLARHHLTELKRHNELLAIQVSDPLELAIPVPGEYGISDGQRRTLLNLRDDTPRQRFHAYFAERHLRARALFDGLRVPRLRLRTTDDLALMLRRGLSGRGDLAGGDPESVGEPSP
ncbi:MAG: DUF58 domain-containing protein [Thiotrichales bacterium]